MELECIISNQMKDYRLIHSVKFQDHITNTEQWNGMCMYDGHISKAVCVDSQ